MTPTCRTVGRGEVSRGALSSRDSERRALRTRLVQDLDCKLRVNVTALDKLVQSFKQGATESAASAPESAPRHLERGEGRGHGRRPAVRLVVGRLGDGRRRGFGFRHSQQATERQAKGGSPSGSRCRWFTDWPSPFFRKDSSPPSFSLLRFPLSPSSSAQICFLEWEAVSPLFVLLTGSCPRSASDASDHAFPLFPSPHWQAVPSGPTPCFGQSPAPTRALSIR